MAKNYKIAVLTADVRTIECDVLVLKYAQSFYGVDAIVATLLSRAYKQDLHIGPITGEYRFVPAAKAIAASYVLYLGVSPLHEFGYHDVRVFSKNASRPFYSEV